MPSNDQHTQEIRFAVVLYGGVSLAIYISGVVQELLRMVRATSGLRPRNAGTSEGVYRKLGCLLQRGVPPPNDAASYNDIPINPPQNIESLLNSRRMYYRLLKAFDAMDEDGRGPPRNDQ